MESEESRPGCSESNSSTNSYNSQIPVTMQLNLNDDINSVKENQKGCNITEIEDQVNMHRLLSPNYLNSPVADSIKNFENALSSENDNQLNTCNNELCLPQNQTKSSTAYLHSSINTFAFLKRGRKLENQDIKGDVYINHEDLSDVSDTENDKKDSVFNTDEDLTHVDNSPSKMTTDPTDGIMVDLREKLSKDKKQNQIQNSYINNIMNHRDVENLNGKTGINESLEDFVKSHDEDTLDFEAEEGECQEHKDGTFVDITENLDSLKPNKTHKKLTEKIVNQDELEEGEVSDDEEKRPEEVEPKPVCRFYTRGQCTWGMSCRFLHPGVTDKGNYTMFDLVRPISLPQANVAAVRNNYTHTNDYTDYRSERVSTLTRANLHNISALYSSPHDPRALASDGPVVVESAWERGLRTAKEMMRKASKRKEQDTDFEDKKMNLTLSPDDLEKDPYYAKERGSPVEVMKTYNRHGIYNEVSVYNSLERFSRPPISSLDDIDTYGRTSRYRELPPHRMPHYEDERRVRPTREVIVQRVESVTRADEWNDPWMRKKSPGGTSRDRNDKRRRERSYSTNSSYSSSTSSQSESSSDSSRSTSPLKERRYNSFQKSPSLNRRYGVRNIHSPNSVRRSRRSMSLQHSPTARRGHHISLSPALIKTNAHSPSHKRKKSSPIAKKYVNIKSKTKRKNTGTSSGTGSSDSSGSDSDSESGSSSSDSSSCSVDQRLVIKQKLTKNRKSIKKVLTKKRSPISIEIKKQNAVGTSALISPTNSISSEKGLKKSRREELLKQLRAVEDAIAKKRLKLT
ncbi:zinc finger CCCH domain-containing protein 18-like isoform X2 [Teleopsis dalmanni]|uniref:zinc finger CCCH domain-containing protein 18-like isoform X2 n=1 Tax=Teleopsis dalmanni TaxID=139649 RepID=UPI0018CF128C|nr:zinc finger CCCH domain-containing protein 18-like isoform X2 [Teleopsis dalmanni]